MHDCQKTRARLIDLVYDEETGDAATAGLRAVVESCPGCRAELRALTETLRAFDRAGAWQQPGEDEWAGYQTRLAARLHRAAREGDSPASRAHLHSDGRTSPATDSSATPVTSLPSPATRDGRAARWPRRALTATWRVPAPLAVAAVALLAVCLSLLALRPARAVDAPAVRTGETAPAPARVVEVPVVQEKIVTRTVYVTRPSRSRMKQETRSSPGELARGAGADKKSPRAADTLVGFQPAEDVKVRVIKGNYANEK